MGRGRISLTAAAVAAVAIISVVAGVAGPVGKDDGSPPEGAITDRARYAADVATARAARQPQAGYLAQFMKSGRSLKALPLRELEASYYLAGGLEEAVSLAEVVGLFRVTSIEYFASNMADTPATRVTYAPVRLVKGAVPPSGAVTIEFLGGPYRTDTGEEVALALPLMGIDVQGMPVFAAFTSDGKGAYRLAEVGAKFAVLNGLVEADAAAKAYGLSGLPLEAVEGRARAVVR